MTNPLAPSVSCEACTDILRHCLKADFMPNEMIRAAFAATVRADGHTHYVDLDGFKACYGLK